MKLSKKIFITFLMIVATIINITVSKYHFLWWVSWVCIILAITLNFTDFWKK